MNRFLVAAGIFVFLITGCSRIPQTPDSVILKTAYDKQNKAEPFILRIEARIANPTDSTVFTDYSADYVLYDQSGKKALEFTLKKDSIFPFARAVLFVEKKYSKEAFAPVAAAFLMNVVDIEQKGIGEPVQLEAKQYSAGNVKAGRKNIFDVFKEGKK